MKRYVTAIIEKEIARDVARRLIEAQTERNSKKILLPIGNAFDLQVVVAC
ncbi:MAG: hypothetical protein HQK65_23285 [Desulfamplus sp.]|nr:hypothetical protein [Desulfamplus sp.]